MTKKSHLSFLIIALFLVNSAQLQSIELISRYSYYTHETEATIIIWGEDIQKVESISSHQNKSVLRITEHQQERLLVEFPIADLAVGTHKLKLQVKKSDGSQMKQSVEIIKLQSTLNEVKVDRLTGGLIVDDLPFFPFGFYTGFPVGDVITEEAYNRMNLIGVYQKNDQETLDKRKAYMDLCASLGMKVNYHVNGLVGSSHNKPGQTISKKEIKRREAILKQEVQTFKNHPALLSWYMNDEPVGQGRPPELLERAYQIIKKADPYHPVSVVFVIPDRARPFENALDIAMTDPYPIPGNVNHVRELMGHLRNHFKYKKALWLVPQAFGGGEFWTREPTAPEIRIMTYLGILDGAMGIKYFIRRRPNLFPKSRLAWNECSRIAHEVSVLIPWLFSENGCNHITTSKKNIIAVTWQKRNSNLLIVANTENTPHEFSLNLERVQHSGKARLIFENRTVDLEGNWLRDLIEPYGVRIYILENKADQSIVDSKHNNLFINHGFETCYSPGVPFGCYASSKTRDALYAIDSRTAFQGQNSLRFTLPTDTSNISLGFFKMLVNKGRLYKCSLWTSTPKNQEPISLNVKLNELNLKKTITAGRDWTNFSFSFKVDKEIKAVGLSLSSIGKGTIWIDQVEVFPDPLIDVTVAEGSKATIAIESLTPGTEIFYSNKSADNSGKFFKYTQPIEVREFTELQLKLSKDGKPFQEMTQVIPLSKATNKTCVFQTPYSPKYTASGDGSILDGEYGTLAFRDKKWLGWAGTDVDFTVDLGAEKKISQAVANFLISIKDGIHAPISMEVKVSLDNKRYGAFGKFKNPEKTQHHNPNCFMELNVKGKEQIVRYVRFEIKSPKIIPEGYLFSGTDAWIFIDEVLIH